MVYFSFVVPLLLLYLCSSVFWLLFYWLAANQSICRGGCLVILPKMGDLKKRKKKEEKALSIKLRCSVNIPVIYLVSILQNSNSI